MKAINFVALVLFSIIVVALLTTIIAPARAQHHDHMGPPPGVVAPRALTPGEEWRLREMRRHEWERRNFYRPPIVVAPPVYAPAMPGARWYQGRWWEPGTNPCWQMTPAGWAWTCQ